MWKALQHPNVLPLIGVTMGEAQFAMVSEWMANGSINEFVKANPGVDRVGLVGFPFRALLSSSRWSSRNPLARRCREGTDLHS